MSIARLFRSLGLMLPKPKRRRGVRPGATNTVKVKANKYMPHQGERECARRRRQMERSR